MLDISPSAAETELVDRAEGPAAGPRHVPNASLRAVVADDEPLARARMRTLLLRHAGVAPIAECKSGAEAIDAVRRLEPDLLLLDLHMPDAQGLQVVRAVGVGVLPALVFVTAYQEHALAAFEHQALDYLLKPVSDERFRQMLERVRAHLALRREATPAATPAATPPPPAAGGAFLKQLLVRSLQKIEIVDVAQVDWLQSDGDYVRVWTGKVSRLHRATLAELEQQLDPSVFVRIHRSTIVRTSRIRELEPYFHGEYVVVLHDGTRLKLSRTYRARLEAALGQGL
jgi:two-component system LytT family response regulator